VNLVGRTLEENAKFPLFTRIVTSGDLMSRNYEQVCAV
jgi:hypothetical protein